jgi:glycosyltransferase involved in cell wall biosynthesis
MRPLVIVDNFRIGGLERLALDQLFLLSDMGLKPLALYRQSELTSSLPNFLNIEKSRIDAKGLEIMALPNSDFRQLLAIRRIFMRENISVIINHSVGAAVILRLALLITGKKAPIKTFIHQLPSLSARVQRTKRFLYSLFSTEIYGYSSAVVSDWNKRTTLSAKIFQFRFGKKIKLLRNGIYLERLPKVLDKEISKQDTRRLVFIGRNVAWKNLPYLEKLLNHPLGSTFTALIIIPSIEEETKNRLISKLGDRITFEIGKKIEDIEFWINDINVYPVDYGPSAKFIESISLNCLEMACLGIPSLVTAGGTSTWPELEATGLIVEADWSNIESVLLAMRNLKEISDADRKLCRQIIDVRINLAKIFSL